MFKLHRVLFAVILVAIMSVPCADAQDNEAWLDVVATELSPATVTDGSGKEIGLELALRCLAEADRTDEVADSVGMDLSSVGSHLSRRVWDGTYRESTWTDVARVAFSVLRGPNAGSEYGSAYRFPVDAVLNRSQGDHHAELTTRIDLGSVSFVAWQYDDSYRVVGPDEAEWRAVRDQIQQGNPPVAPEYQFVARDNTLFGVESDDRLVSWNAKSSVPPNRVFLDDTLLPAVADVTSQIRCASTVAAGFGNGRR